MAYADDATKMAELLEELRKTVQAKAYIMVVLNIRLNHAKSNYASSTGDGVTTISVWALDGVGRMALGPLTPVPAQGLDPKSKTKPLTMAERGIVKYLGVLYSFLGEFGDTDGWAPQRRAVVKKANAFIASVAMVAPSLNEYRKLCNGLFAPRVCYPMQVMPLTTELLSKVRGIITKGALSVLKVQHRSDETITSALVHTGEGWLGLTINALPGHEGQR